MSWAERGNPKNIPSAPWMHPAVVAYLDMLIKPDWKVLEHGCGGSTVWFAKRAAMVDAAEDNDEWAMAVGLATGSNVRVHVKAEPDDFETGCCDLLLIDGARHERQAWIASAMRLTKPGGVVVLDNSNRTEYQEARDALRNDARHFVTFCVNPPGYRFSHTEFYRMPGGEVDWI